MRPDSPRWKESTPSEHSHERAGRSRSEPLRAVITWVTPNIVAMASLVLTVHW